MKYKTENNVSVRRGGSLQILDLLPPANTKRWVPQRKIEVVAAVDGGAISIDFACQCYNLTLEEFASWQRTVNRARLKSLRIARAQFYRDLCMGSASQADVPAVAQIPQHESLAVSDSLPASANGDDGLGLTLPSDAFGPGPAPPDRRGEPRFALLLRVAKLVIDGSEQFCVIRDASTTGVKIKLFAPIPAHSELAVELASGERYPVQCIWSDAENAGLQFCEPIPLDHLLVNARGAGRRHHLRLRISLEGVLHLGETAEPITFHDISQHGAAFRTEKWLLVNELVKIETKILSTIYARVRWRNHPDYGVSFEHTFQLQDLAERVSGTQPCIFLKEQDGDQIICNAGT